MKIFFSTLFDNETYPVNIYMKNGIALGDLHLGPIGFISLLELHLGLLKPQTLQALRLLKYRDALRKVAEGETSNLGDTTTLLDPAVVEEIINGRL